MSLTNNVGVPDSSVGPLSAAQKLVKDDYFGGLDMMNGDGWFQAVLIFCSPTIIHLRARAVRVVVMT